MHDVIKPDFFFLFLKHARECTLFCSRRKYREGADLTDQLENPNKNERNKKLRTAPKEFMQIKQQHKTLSLSFKKDDCYFIFSPMHKDAGKMKAEACQRTCRGSCTSGMHVIHFLDQNGVSIGSTCLLY